MLLEGPFRTFNYTLGHAIDNTTDVRNTLPTNSYDLRNERGNSTFDIRHIVTSFVSYEVPAVHAPRAPPDEGLAAELADHVPRRHAAQHSGRHERSGTGENRDRVDLVGDPFANVPVLTGTTAIQYINKAAFANRPPARSGTSAAT